MNYIKEEYKQFVNYVKGTWKQLVEEWKEKAEIKEVWISFEEGTFEVLVFFKENTYPVFKSGELHEVAYNGEGIYTSYYLNNELLLYTMLCEDIVADVGLDKDKIVTLEYFSCGYHKELSKDLSDIQGSWFDGI